MSQVCKYYLKGTCRFGNSCHYIHDNSYSSYGNRNHHNDYSYNTYSKNNYGRYHVDRRQESQSHYTQQHHSQQQYYQQRYAQHEYQPQYSQQRYVQHETESNNSLSLHDYVTIVKNEIKQFEEKHVWFLSVIAPLSEYGNLPGFEDYSPEEVRFQYYLACNDNTQHNFKEYYDRLISNVGQCCHSIKSKSQETYEIVKKLLAREPINESNMYSESLPSHNSAAASSFTFDLSALQRPNDPQPNFGSPTGFTNATYPQQSGFSTTAPLFGTTDSQLSTFSFDLKKLNSAPSSNTPNSAPFGIPNPVEGASASSMFAAPGHVDKAKSHNPNYSALDELKPEYVEAFRAKTFKSGKLPLDPPPKELCY